MSNSTITPPPTSTSLKRPASKGLFGSERSCDLLDAAMPTAIASIPSQILIAGGTIAHERCRRRGRGWVALKRLTGHSGLRCYGNQLGRRRDELRQDGVVVPSRAASRSVHPRAFNDGLLAHPQEARGRASQAGAAPGDRLLLRLPDGQRSDDGPMQTFTSIRRSGRSRCIRPRVTRSTAVCSRRCTGRRRSPASA